VQGARLLVVGTYRDVEVDRAHPLSSALAELRRGSSSQRVLLRGLTADEVQRMLSGISGPGVPWGLAEAVHRQTEGNPLFVQEVVRYLVEEGLITREGGRWQPAGSTPLVETIPEGLRDVIGKRLSRLSEPCNRLLTIAAVIGQDFALQTLQAVSGSGEDEVVAALAEALRVAVLQDTSRPGSVRYRFAHGFFRQTLYEELITPRRLRLHQQVARALEQQYAGRLDEHAAELAEHFAQSSDPSELGKAVAYGQRAAQRASSVYAHGEAVRLLEQALAVQAVLDPDDCEARCDLLLALAAVLPAAGEALRAAAEVAEEAFQLAAQLADAARAFRACQCATTALRSYGGGSVWYRLDYRAWVERLVASAAPGTVEQVRADIALGELGNRPGSTLAERRRGAALVRGALELARRLGEPETLCFAASSFVIAAGLVDEADALAVAEEFAQHPLEGVSTDTAARLLTNIAYRLLWWGQRARADAVFGRLQALADRTHDPIARLAALNAAPRFRFVDGELEAAVTAGEQLVAAGVDHGMPQLAQQQVMFAARDALVALGRFADVLTTVATFEATAGLTPQMTGLFRAGSLAQLGRLAEARATFADATDALGPPDVYWRLPPLVWLLEVALALGERERVAEAVAVFDGVATLPAGGYVGSCQALRVLGDARAFLGEPERALAYYQHALAAAGRIRHRPELALAQLGMAEVLAAGDPAEREQAGTQLAVALSELAAMGMAPALARAQALQTRLTASATSAPPAPAVEPAASRRPRRRATQPAGTVTFLFSDVVSSMPEFQRRGDRLAREFFRRHDELCQEQASRFGGHVYRREGDGFFIAFQSTREALRCAIAIQHGLPQAYADTKERPHVRIGLHVGETVEEEGDYYGGAVNLAARVRNEAVGDQILVTELVQGIAQGEPELRCRFVREAQVKGVDGVVRLYELLWQEEAG
jgi:class 3 adenylate cyclase